MGLTFYLIHICHKNSNSFEAIVFPINQLHVNSYLVSITGWLLLGHSPSANFYQFAIVFVSHTYVLT